MYLPTCTFFFFTLLDINIYFRPNYNIVWSEIILLTKILEYIYSTFPHKKMNWVFGRKYNLKIS